METRDREADVELWWWDNPANGAVGHPAGTPLEKRKFARRCKMTHKYGARCAMLEGHGPMVEWRKREVIKVTGLKVTPSGLIDKSGQHSSWHHCMQHFSEFAGPAKPKAKRARSSKKPAAGRSKK